MSTIKEKTLKQVEREVDLFMFTKLIELEFGSVGEKEMCVKLKEEFNINIEKEELKKHYEPTVNELEEDYKLIYKNCVY